MPCNIGYKEIARINIPKPIAKKFKAKVDPPKIDQELLNKIGEEDNAFVDWINGLDITPLLGEALKRSLSAIDPIKNMKVSINNDGSLDISGNYNDENAKRKLETSAKKLSKRYQMEVMGIVAQLLEYRTEISQDGKDLILEGEKHQHSHGQVNRYLKVTDSGVENGEIRFEHFASPEKLKSEKRKCLALAQKLGAKINLEII